MKFKNLFSWNLSPPLAIQLQVQLRKKIKLQKFLKVPQLVAAVDVAFKNQKAKGVVVVVRLPDFKVIECVCRIAKITYPYIPGLLAFREGPVLEKCFRALKQEPEVIIFDGQGIAHPRNMGLATHFGIILDKPTIGCAKTHLFGEYTLPSEEKGAYTYIFDAQKNKIGAVLRTKDNVKPLFISAGHKMDIESAIKIILMCTRKYRLPEVMRLAHQLSIKNF